MDRILGGIYVGSYHAIAANVDLKGKYKISHVLSVIQGELPETLTKHYKVKQIAVSDDPSENIVDFFQLAIAFIDSALFPKEPKNSSTSTASDAAAGDAVPAPAKKNPHKGAILIHCAQGISRSVAFTIAYLMYKYKLSLQNALYAVQRRRDGAQPNEGFMEQLHIFETALKNNEYHYENIDLTSEEEYREWLFKSQMEDEELRNRFLANDKSYAPVEVNDKIAQDDQIKEKVESDESKVGGHNLLLDTTNANTDKPNNRITQLRCKKCRQPLALLTSFIPHTKPEAGSRHANFISTSGFSNRIVGVQKASDFCSHIFTEPLNWMKEELQGKGELLGKFYCPNLRCGTKVGTYSWKGSRCSCGRWVVPAISLQTAKVDEAFITEHSNFEQIKRLPTSAT